MLTAANTVKEHAIRQHQNACDFQLLNQILKTFALSLKQKIQGLFRKGNNNTKH